MAEAEKPKEQTVLTTPSWALRSWERDGKCPLCRLPIRHPLHLHNHFRRNHSSEMVAGITPVEKSPVEEASNA